MGTVKQPIPSTLLDHRECGRTKTNPAFRSVADGSLAPRWKKEPKGGRWSALRARVVAPGKTNPTSPCPTPAGCHRKNEPKVPVWAGGIACVPSEKRTHGIPDGLGEMVRDPPRDNSR